MKVLFTLPLTQEEKDNLGYVILFLTSRHDCVFLVTQYGEVLCEQKDTPDGQGVANEIADEWRTIHADHNLSRPYHRKEFMRIDSSCFHPRATSYYKAAALLKLHLRKQLAYRSGVDVGTEGLMEAPPLTEPSATNLPDSNALPIGPMGLPIGPTGAINPNPPMLTPAEADFDAQSIVTPVPRYLFSRMEAIRLEDAASWYTTTTP